MMAALYARVSTSDQDPNNQILRLQQFADLKGWRTNQYIDVASGANLRRPALDRMLEDCKRGEINVVMATKLDRMTRSVINLNDIMIQLDKWGVRVVFLDQPIDTTDSTGRLTMNILACIAQFEKELIHDRTVDGLARAAAEGRHGGRPRRELSPYQIKRATEILEKNPQISQRELAAQFNGISKSTLIKLLRERGMIS